MGWFERAKKAGVGERVTRSRDRSKVLVVVTL
jgi:hypothetical protein